MFAIPLWKADFYMAEITALERFHFLVHNNSYIFRTQEEDSQWTTGPNVPFIQRLHYIKY